MRRRNNISFPRTNSKTVVYTGGVNEGITNLELGAGDLFQCYNYEEIDGAFHGYSSVEGYERYDGQPSPSGVPVEFLEDEGDDAFAVVLLESLTSEDTTDKSESDRVTTQSNLSYSSARLQFGEGSWYFNNLVSSKWTCDLSDEPIDFATEVYTLDGVIQTNDIFLSTVVVAEISGVIKITLEEGITHVYLTTSSGVEEFVGTSLANAGRWYLLSVVVEPSATTCDVYIGLNGNVDSFTSTGAGVHAASDLVIGDGDSSDKDLYVDTFRLSNVTRWKSTVEFAYTIDYPFSDYRYYVFNADDADREAARALITELETTAIQCEEVE